MLFTGGNVSENDGMGMNGQGGTSYVTAEALKTYNRYPGSVSSKVRLVLVILQFSINM
jgi:hypothetical protein